MAYAYTEKKRIRKDFGKQPSALRMKEPPLLDIQTKILQSIFALQ